MASEKGFYRDCFQTSAEFQKDLRDKVALLTWNGEQEVVYNRTYSREKLDGNKENWADTILRVIHGEFSIVKSRYQDIGTEWDEEYHQRYAEEQALAMFYMYLLPGGRGLWACGTEFVRMRGSMALNNCAFVTNEDFLKATAWTMDALMCGAGVGFDTAWKGDPIIPSRKRFTYVIPDSREGWVESVRLLMKTFMVEQSAYPEFDYSLIRPKGLPIKGFGGLSSGPDPLKKLHRRIEAYFNCYLDANGFRYKFITPAAAIIRMTRTLKADYFENNKDMTEAKFVKLLDQINTIRPHKTYDRTRLIADIYNSIGACVVAGNIRRSSQICLSNPSDSTFMNLKNYMVNPERSEIMWMSNNSCILSTSEEFAHHIPRIAKGIELNGEPGVFNKINTQRYGRVRHYNHPEEQPTREQEPDKAIGTNPCVVGTTLVMTSNGLRRVNELIGKDFYAVIDGKDYPCYGGFYSTGVQTVYTLMLDDGKTLTATANHKVLVRKGDAFEWNILRDLVQGDIIPYSMDNTSVPKESTFMGLFDKKTDEVYDCKVDTKHCYSADGIFSHNCGEISLESFELCNLSDVFMPKFLEADGSFNEEEFYRVIEMAAFYVSAITLLPTHSDITNEVIDRNHRVGVGLSGIATVYDVIPTSQLIKILRHAYRLVRNTNTRLAEKAKINPSIRVTTVKPSGTVGTLAGVSPGIHFKICSRYVIRRIRIESGNPVSKLLIEHGIPHEKDQKSDSTTVFEFPLDQGPGRSENEVSMFEQIELTKLLMTEYADNSVSVTIKFDPETEAPHIEKVLALALPEVKSLSFLSKNTSVYPQSPYESITEEEYKRRKALIPKIDWSKLKGDADGSLSRGCDGDKCEYVPMMLSQ